MADGRTRGPGVFARAGAALGLAFLLAAAGPAAADEADFESHLHFRVVLSSNTATEGQTGKITVNVECAPHPNAGCSFAHPGNANRTGADITITATNPSGSNNGVTQAGTTVGYTFPAIQGGVSPTPKLSAQPMPGRCNSRCRTTTFWTERGRWW